MKAQKRTVLFAAAAILVVAAGSLTYYQLSKTGSGEESRQLTSKNQRITLREPQSDAAIGGNSQIAGTYKARKDQALLYTIRNAEKAVVASGVMTPDNTGAFSRNISFETKPKNNEKLSLEIAAQDTKGDKTDELRLAVTYRE